MKKKLLVVLVCLSITGMAWARQAREVINIDLNVDGDANAYAGKAAYDTNGALYDDGTNTWLVFYPNMTVKRCTIPGWGLPMSSPRCSHLGDANDPNNPGIYAKAVWIGDAGVGRTAFRDTTHSSPGLMNDGLQKTSGEPNLFFWGREGFGGTYDFYVYGTGEVNVVRYNAEQAVWQYSNQTLTGTPTYGTFVLNQNYAKFSEVNVTDSNCVLKTLYVDGAKVTNLGNSDVLRFYRQLSNDGHQLAIAADGNLPIPKNSGFNGKIDEFAVYKGILDSTRITAHYTATAANYYNTVHADTPLVWYRFEDAHSGDGYTAADSGSQGLVGTYHSDAAHGGSIILVAGHAGNCASFNQGTDSNCAWIFVDDSAKKLNMENITVECWINTTQLDGNSPSIYNHNPSRGQQNAYGATLRTSSTGVLDANNGVGMIGAGNINNVDVNGLNDGNWHQVVIVYQDVAGGTFVHYSDKIFGLQLVSTKTPIVLPTPNGDDPNTLRTLILPSRYDVAGDRTGQTAQGGESGRFGPSFVGNGDPNYPIGGTAVNRIERREFMDYDINVPNAAKGKYRITVDVDPYDGYVGMQLLLDDVNLGHTTRAVTGGKGVTSPAIDVNMVPGYHTLRWFHDGYDGSSTGYTILDVNLVFVGNDDANYAPIADCGGVAHYNLLLPGDLNKDCKVDKNDLKIMADTWLTCNDPLQSCP